MIGTQLTLVLLAAPAATAGAICVDRARGTLMHMLVTDLSAGEIVLGKLAARLAPVLGMLACTFPVLEILTLLGGIDPNAILGAVVVTVGVAVLSCSLAMTLSLWAGKTHQALLLTYCGLVLVAAGRADGLTCLLRPSAGRGRRLRGPRNRFSWRWRRTGRRARWDGAITCCFWQ